MKNAIETINKILAEELDVIAEDKREFVAKRIVDELKLDRLHILSLDNLPKESCSFKPPVNEYPLKPVNLKNNEDYICATRITVKNSNYGWTAWCDWISGNIAEEGNIEGMIATRYYEASLTEAIDHVLEFMNKMGVKRSDEIEMEGILGFDLYYEEDDEDTLSEELKKVIKEEAEKRKWRCIIEY